MKQERKNFEGIDYEVLRSWEGGPLRQFSPDHIGSFISYADSRSPSSVFAGSYVCEGCMSPTGGVRRSGTSKRWLCAPCLDAEKPKREKI